MNLRKTPSAKSLSDVTVLSSPVDRWLHEGLADKIIGKAIPSNNQQEQKPVSIPDPTLPKRLERNLRSKEETTLLIGAFHSLRRQPNGGYGLSATGFRLGMNLSLDSFVLMSVLDGERLCTTAPDGVRILTDRLYSRQDAVYVVWKGVSSL